MDFDYIKGYSEFLPGDLESDFINDLEQLECETTVLNKEIYRSTESVEHLKTHWIKTTEKLPEIEKEVIVCDRSSNVKTMIFTVLFSNNIDNPYFYNEWNEFEVEGYIDPKKHKSSDITHWMPLPEPPETV